MGNCFFASYLIFFSIPDGRPKSEVGCTGQFQSVDKNDNGYPIYWTHHVQAKKF